MRFAIILAAPLLLAAAGDMRVSTFLTKAEALQKKGPLALMSSDLGLLRGEVQGAAASYRRDLAVARTSGDKSIGCPVKGTKLEYGPKELMRDLKVVPVAERSRTSVKQAFYQAMKRRYPCR